MKQDIEQIEKLRLEEFEKLENIVLTLSDGTKIEIPFCSKNICKEFEERLMEKIQQEEICSEDEKEYILDVGIGENEQLLILKVLKNICVLKLEELNAKIKTEHYIREHSTKKPKTEFQNSIEKFQKEVFGEDVQENMAEILLTMCI